MTRYAVTCPYRHPIGQGDEMVRDFAKDCSVGRAAGYTF